MYLYELFISLQIEIICIYLMEAKLLHVKGIAEVVINRLQTINSELN